MTMEFDEIVVKESPGLCRCCLSEGCYKDLGSEYTWMNETEVYADMLLECFDISITQHNEGPNGPNRLICEVCITRLRDACNFKKQVLDSEKKFIDMMGRGEFRPKMLIYQAQMKSENPIVEAPTEETEVEYLDDDIDFADDTEEFKDESEPTVSDITVSSLPIKGKRGRPKKTVVKTEKKVKVSKVEEKPKTSKAVAKDEKRKKKNTVKDQIEDLSVTEEKNKKRKRDEDDTDTSISVDITNEKKKAVEKTRKKTGAEEEAKRETRHLLTVIIETSTAMPFRKNGNTYRCFYCETNFYYASELRAHTLNEHKNETKRQLKQTINRNVVKKNLIVKLDVTNLTCKLCSESFVTLKDLIFHFSKHDKVVTDNLENMLCLKLSDNEFKCLYCDKEFPFFKTLYIHLHREHVNRRFICETCGLNFTTNQGLNNHTAYVHNQGSFICPDCGKKFAAQHLRSAHMKRSHDPENIKCHVCKAIFRSVNQKDTHLAKEHNIWITKEFKCDKCSKSFKYNHMLMTHIKRVHLKEKNFTCDYCGDKFFEKKLLELHQIKHSDAKPYECKTCKKRFPRKNALYRHEKIHTDPRNLSLKRLPRKTFEETSCSQSSAVIS